MNPALVDHPAYNELAQVILRLGMMSQVSSAPLGRSSKSTDEDIGGRRPSGGVVHRDDFQVEYRQKSAVYFQRKLRRCNNIDQLVKLLKEAEDALEAWRKQPLPTERPASMADPQWKLWVAYGDADIRDIVRWYSVTRQHVWAIRKSYRGLEAA